MCFGGKKERSDDAPPRPAQNYQGQQRPPQQQSPGRNSYNKNDYKMSNFSSSSASAGASQNQHGVVGSSSSSTGYGAARQEEQYAPPPGPPPSHRQQNHLEEQQYAPPAGPPPSHTQQRQEEQYAPPAGPPPSHTQQQAPSQEDYAPPPGPPPSNNKNNNNSWIVPPQDDLSKQQSQHNWEAVVPDTSLFPPPPAIFSGYDRSPANNSTEAEAEAGEAWCAQYPLTQPINLDAAGTEALRTHNFRLIEPAGLDGRLDWLGPGVWEVSTAHTAPDRSLISYPPLYVVSQHDPTATGRAKTVYYEVKIRSGSPSANIAMGFSALPYPSFRLPGWHRGSLAVHGDDGHKYINDRWGGKDFTREFRPGETYGIGMRFAPPARGSGQAAHRPSVRIFFTRNGAETGGWDLHEETDAQEDLPVTGLEGFHDVCCSIGMFEGTEFEVVFDPAKWMYRGFGGE